MFKKIIRMLLLDHFYMQPYHFAGYYHHNFCQCTHYYYRHLKFVCFLLMLLHFQLIEEYNMLPGDAANS